MTSDTKRKTEGAVPGWVNLALLTLLALVFACDRYVYDVVPGIGDADPPFSLAHAEAAYAEAKLVASRVESLESRAAAARRKCDATDEGESRRRRGGVRLWD